VQIAPINHYRFVWRDKVSIQSLKRKTHIEFRVESQHLDDDGMVWDGLVTSVIYHGTHIEFFVESLSNFTAIVGQYSTGTFLCVPRLGIGLALGAPIDVIHGVDKIYEGNLTAIPDAITAVYALAALERQGIYKN
jgi:hypothetical protein